MTNMLLWIVLFVVVLIIFCLCIPVFTCRCIPVFTLQVYFKVAWLGLGHFPYDLFICVYMYIYLYVYIYIYTYMCIWFQGEEDWRGASPRNCKRISVYRNHPHVSSPCDSICIKTWLFNALKLEFWSQLFEASNTVIILRNGIPLQISIIKLGSHG